jgi:hypothetical protein
MQIKGPMKISVAKSPDGRGRVLIEGLQADARELAQTDQQTQ